MKDEFYVPDPLQVGAQSSTNRQGRNDEALATNVSESFSESVAEAQKSCMASI
jgi:hypothetical protein